MVRRLVEDLEKITKMLDNLHQFVQCYGKLEDDNNIDLCHEIELIILAFWAIGFTSVECPKSTFNLGEPSECAGFSTLISLLEETNSTVLKVEKSGIVLDFEVELCFRLHRLIRRCVNSIISELR